ncbi:uncharacterized protein N7479_002945 [Penicillium vulpinum]|uniref:uncharacterized protein n=1 Tax=Penicillium vulpinum TaxID=29845 RepID=UPI0025486EBB|nr:uncharacterized protein N7479_002945 [Penicillium vulpinum]KAJ5973027.1 hypothetical protein N7479_002945 [Penicillium vulpinum]
MTRFVSLVSLNHPVVHEFHGPISDSRMLIQGLGSISLVGIVSRYLALKINDLVLAKTFGFTFSTPPRCLFCHEPPKGNLRQIRRQKKKDAEKRNNLCRMHKIHIILI